MYQKLKRLFLFFFLLLKVLFVGSKGFFSHLFSFSGSEFSTCTKVGSLSKKVLKTDEAKCKIASGSLTKKKKNICLGWKKKGTMLFVLEEKRKCCWLTVCSKNTFVCFQKQNGKPCQYILLPKTVNHDFSCPWEKNIRPTQL